jgi:hypothetical protein
VELSIVKIILPPLFKITVKSRYVIVINVDMIMCYRANAIPHIIRVDSSEMIVNNAYLECKARITKCKEDLLNYHCTFKQINKCRDPLNDLFDLFDLVWGHHLNS